MASNPYLAFAAMAAALVATPALSAPPAARTEIPIRDVVLSDGAHRYAVAIKVGQTFLDAGLDSGSTGLRVLPGALAAADATQSGGDDSYAYGSGAKYDGVVGRGVLTLGEDQGTATLQMIRKVGCLAAQPHCPVSRIPESQYGIQGDGLPGEGFKAILGVNMAKADVNNPLEQAGARRWIIELPRPGETAPGRLVLNPTDEETQGYVMLPIDRQFATQRGGLHDAVAGCLVNEAAAKKACGPVLLDTGAPGFSVLNAKTTGEAWPTATLAFLDGSGHAAATERLTMNSRAQATHLEFRDAAQPAGTAIYSGLAAYFGFSVLYDPAKGLVGLKPRPAGPGGAVAALATVGP